jgi:GNAT superfamily N-acetyltransferase
MNFTIRRATAGDETFLWQMLYYAAHMDEEPGMTVESAKMNPDLAYYVENWGAGSADVGFIAIAPDGSLAGAAWIRLMPPSSPLYRYVAADVPELAIAVAPGSIGSGAGTALMRSVLDEARDRHHTIALSVRATNPAKRLYERFGFATVVSIRNRVGTESFVMRCDLV